jgi:hypothetical protein
MRTIRWHGRVCAAAVVAGLAGAAFGQNEWFIDIAYSDPAGVINSLDDTTTVTLWAAWDPEQYALQRAVWDMTADDLLDAGNWSNPFTFLFGPHFDNGTIEGESIRGIAATQLHFPEAGIYADTANPIAAWTATWQTSDLTGRVVRVNSLTSEFSLYLPNGEGGSDGHTEDFVDSLIEGSAVIVVVPTPAPVATFAAVGTVLASRRCRSHRRNG